MKQAQIYVDGRGYQGEDLERLEERKPGLASGFSSHNLGKLNALKFGTTGMDIAGEINIKSHLERILTRLRNKTLNAQKIVIYLEEVE